MSDSLCDLLSSPRALLVLAVILGLGWVGFHTEEAKITPVSGAQAGSAASADYYFPASYVIQPNENEPEVYEYH